MTTAVLDKWNLMEVRGDYEVFLGRDSAGLYVTSLVWRCGAGPPWGAGVWPLRLGQNCARRGAGRCAAPPLFERQNHRQPRRTGRIRRLETVLIRPTCASPGAHRS